MRRLPLALKLFTPTKPGGIHGKWCAVGIGECQQSLGILVAAQCHESRAGFSPMNLWWRAEASKVKRLRYG